MSIIKENYNETGFQMFFNGHSFGVGYGETRAKYNNDTREGRKLNRRVELQMK